MGTSVTERGGPAPGRVAGRATHGGTLPPPHTHNAPVTSNKPDGNCFRNTTRFPLNRPVNRISTVPGVMLARSLAPPALKARLRRGATSSAG